ncbi:MAG: glycosyltransferase family 39 protein [Candidatus Sumerlaeia bacterium]
MRLHWISNTLMAVTIAVLAALSSHLATRWAGALAYPFQLDATEGFILEQAMTIAQGQTIYGPIDRPPFLVGNYPPLFQAIYAGVNGSKASLWSLALGRRLTIASTILAALLMAAIVHRMTRALAPAILAAFLFLVSYEVHQWSAFVRVDMPALAFTLGGVFAFVSSKRRWSMALAGALLAAAVYTRQTAILAPAACAIALAIGDRRRLAWFLGPMLGIALAALAFLEWTSGGEFLRHIVAYNANRMDWGGWARLMKNEIWFFNRFLVVALAAMIAARLVRGREKPPEGGATNRRALAIYAILGAISLLSYAKVGAAPNYVLEPLAATAIWLCAGLGALLNGQGRRAHIAAIVVCALLLIHSGWCVTRQREMFSSPTPTAEDKRVAGELTQYLRGVDGDLMCEEPMFTLLAGRPILFDPFIMTTLAREAKWDQTAFVHMIEKQSFARIVTCENLAAPRPYYERYTELMADAVRRHYRIVGGAVLPGLGREYFIYEPAKSE